MIYSLNNNCNICKIPPYIGKIYSDDLRGGEEPR